MEAGRTDGWAERQNDAQMVRQRSEWTDGGLYGQADRMTY